MFEAAQRYFEDLRICCSPRPRRDDYDCPYNGADAAMLGFPTVLGWHLKYLLAIVWKDFALAWKELVKRADSLGRAIPGRHQVTYG